MVGEMITLANNSFNQKCPKTLLFSNQTKDNVSIMWTMMTMMGSASHKLWQQIAAKCETQ